MKKKQQQNSSQYRLSLPDTQFTLGLCQTVLGGCAYYMLAPDPTENPIWQRAVRYAASAICTQGLSTLIDSSLIWWSCKQHKKTGQYEPKSAVKRRQVATYCQLMRVQQVFVRGVYIASSALMFYRSLHSMGVNSRAGINPFSLVYPEEYRRKTTIFLAFLDGPIILPGLTILGLVNLFYNFRELFGGLGSDTPRQDDSAFFAFCNSFALMGATATLAKSIKPPRSIDLSFPIGTPTEEILRQVEAATYSLNNPNQGPLHVIGLFNTVAAAKSYFGLTQMAKSAVDEYLQQFSIEVTKAAPKPKRPKRKKKSDQKRHVTPVVVEQPSQANSMPNAGAIFSQETDHAPPERRVKIKTRGVPYPTYRKVTKEKPVSNIKGVAYKPQSKQRVEKITFIQTLRRCKQVKARLMERELAQLINHLPQARVVGHEGSEFDLCWHWNGNDYRIKFEKPHGKKVEYSGAKLTKLLNVLETAYLWGWGQDKIKAHLLKHRIGSRIGRLVNVLFKRPELVLGADLVEDAVGRKNK